MIKSLIRTAVLCMLLLATNGSSAQENNNADEERIIEVYLDSIPGICSSNLNFNDFFAESYVTAKVIADSDGNAKKTRIGKCRTTVSGNSSRKSLDTARRLLLESSRNIIGNTVWNTGKNRCRIVWKPRHPLNNERRQNMDNKLRRLVDGCIADDIKKKIRGTDGSVFLLARTDSEGIIYDIEHIGNICWNTDGNKGKDGDIERMDIIFHSNSNGSTQIRKAYQSKEEKEEQTREEIYGKCARVTGNRLMGRRLCEFTASNGGEERVCIEINIDATGIEIEEKSPVFPGGTEKLRRILEDNLKCSKILRKYNATGAIMVRFVVKENGKAEILDIQSKIPLNCGTGYESRTRLSKEIYENISRTMKQQPQWTPGTYDGKPANMICKLKIKI